MSDNLENFKEFMGSKKYLGIGRKNADILEQCNIKSFYDLKFFDKRFKKEKKEFQDRHDIQGEDQIGHRVNLLIQSVIHSLHYVTLRYPS